jgi:fumarate reductase flavoprotein subunit
MPRRVSKRRFLAQLGALAGVAAASNDRIDAPSRRVSWDVIVVGAGTAGIPLAIFAAQRGARVLLIEAAAQLGGTLLMSTGQMSAAGTKLQKMQGIEDTPQEHFDDVMRISRHTARPEILRLAVENAAATADWLMDCGFKPKAGHPVLGGGHEPYSKKRYFWGEHGGISVLEVLRQQLQPEIDRGRVTLQLNTRVTQLLQRRPRSAVTGVHTLDAAGSSAQHLARSVVLTCGGYGSNTAMFEAMEGIRRYGDTVYLQSQGAGVTMGLDAGGYVRGRECHVPLFNGVLASDAKPSPLLLHLLTDPTYRKAWEIYVNVRGERFVREDTPSFSDKERGLADQPQEQCWVVMDDAILQASPAMSREWSKSDIIDAFGQFPLFYKANSLAELAASTGIDATGLQNTVADYNRGQAIGQDSLGRTHLPLPIIKPPFYAIRMQGYYLLDIVGLAVDENLRVITPSGAAVPGLYAAGELLGMASLQGRCYCGGMSVTPALTFGRLLGSKILPIRGAAAAGQSNFIDA